jgi:nucleoid-associated protein YejK
VDKVLEAVKKAVEEELERSYSEYGFGNFSSGHEGYAVIKEEVEEAEDELERVKKKLNWLWSAVRRNEYPEEALLLLGHYAQLLACEAIQIAAMAVKYRTSLKTTKEDEDHGNKI